MKVFISQPMSGLTNDEIIENRANSVTKILDFLMKIGDISGPEELEIVDNFQFDKPEDTPHLELLGYDIACMAQADCIVMTGDWHTHRGCLVEKYVAEKYGIRVFFEEDFIFVMEDRFYIPFD